MTRAKKMRYLSQYIFLKRDIKRSMQELKEAKEMGKASGHRAKVLEGYLILRIDKLTKLRINIDAVVNQLDDPRLREILLLRYVEGMTFKMIGQELSLNSTYINELHRKAIELIELEA